MQKKKKKKKKKRKKEKEKKKEENKKKKKMNRSKNNNNKRQIFPTLKRSYRVFLTSQVGGPLFDSDSTQYILHCLSVWSSKNALTVCGLG